MVGEERVRASDAQTREVVAILKRHGINEYDPTTIEYAKGRKRNVYFVPSDKGTLVVKTWLKGIGNYFFDELSGVRDVYILGQMEKTGLSVFPKVYGLSEDANEAGKGYIIVSELEGQSYGSLRESMTKEDVEQVIGDLGAIIVKVHNTQMDFPFDYFGDIGVGRIENLVNGMGERMKYLIERKLSDDIVGQYLSDETIGVIEEIIGDTAEVPFYDINNRRPNIVLYDLHTNNILVDKKNGVWRVTGIPDISMPQLADAGLEITPLNMTAFNSPYGRYHSYDAFLISYIRSGEWSDSMSEPARQEVYTIMHLLSAIKLYHGNQDGIRNNWSQYSAHAILVLLDGGTLEDAEMDNGFKLFTTIPV
ncbi:MAG: aminoglycoside phosphotransferase family protein [Candidatus Aenigmatarchaeota archaeon]